MREWWAKILHKRRAGTAPGLEDRDMEREQGDGRPAAAETFQTTAETRFAPAAEGGVLLCLRTGRLFKLNRAGAAIWMGVSDRRPIREIAREISGSSTPDAAIVRCIDSFIGRLGNLGLIGAGEDR